MNEYNLFISSFVKSFAQKYRKSLSTVLPTFVSTFLVRKVITKAPMLRIFSTLPHQEPGISHRIIIFSQVPYACQQYNDKETYKLSKSKVKLLLLLCCVMI